MKLLKIISYLLPMFCASASADEDKAVSKKQKPEKPSGIFGIVLITGSPPVEDAPGGQVSDCDVVILSAKDRKEIKRVRSNSWGGFSVILPPGKYIIFPKNPHGADWGTAKESTVTVWSGFKTEMWAKFDLGW